VQRRRSNQSPMTVVEESKVPIPYQSGWRYRGAAGSAIADELARRASSVFSFGTNDLTQTTSAFSRDTPNAASRGLSAGRDKLRRTIRCATLDRRTARQLIETPSSSVAAPPEARHRISAASMAASPKSHRLLSTAAVLDFSSATVPRPVRAWQRPHAALAEKGSRQPDGSPGVARKRPSAVAT